MIFDNLCDFTGSLAFLVVLEQSILVQILIQYLRVGYPQYPIKYCRIDQC